MGLIHPTLFQARLSPPHLGDQTELPIILSPLLLRIHLADLLDS
jgi:hypothetical protein